MAKRTDPRKRADKTITTIRVPTSDLKLADELKPILESDLGTDFSRHDVLRMAVRRGLRLLAKRHKTDGESK